MTIRASLLSLLIASVLPTLSGCATDTSSDVDSVAQVSLALTGVSPSGTAYILRNVSVSITGPTSTTLNPDDAATSASVSLGAGDYQVELLDGWALERLDSEGVGTVVEASLSSPNPQAVSIGAGTTNHLQFLFNADEPVLVGEGTLNITFGVESGGSNGSFVNNGYATSGELSGFLFTATDFIGGSISPECSGGGDCFSSAGSEACVTGVLVPDFQSFAMLGWQLENSPWVINGSSITLDVDERIDSALRVSISDEFGNLYCADINSGETTIPWSAIMTECWTGMGMPLEAGMPITEISVVAASSGMGEAFDFCLNNVVINP